MELSEEIGNKARLDPSTNDATPQTPQSLPLTIAFTDLKGGNSTRFAMPEVSLMHASRMAVLRAPRLLTREGAHRVLWLPTACAQVDVGSGAPASAASAEAGSM
eukprot:1057438-Rhodomonas_salina.1